MSNLMKKRISPLAVAALVAVSPVSLAATQIEWWHAMDGRLGEKVVEIADKFNASQSEFVLNTVYKGNYSETMTQAISAFRSNNQPHLVQVFEVGTATMMAAKGAIYPVYKLLEDYGTEFDPEAYLKTVTGYYTDTEGNILSMPFNSSTPVLYYNKDLFKKAGVSKPPKTWGEMETIAKKLQDSGVVCGFTTGWQSWVQLENFSAWHNVPLATKQNGFGGFDTEFSFNGELQKRHIGNMARWQKSKIFDYGGRRSDSVTKFYSGECAMYMNSSAALAGVRANATFDFGIGMLPYYDDVAGVPQNSIIGGATLWTMSGHDEESYRGVAAFLTFLSSAEVQADWHQFSGYLPITYAAYELSKKQGYYDKYPDAETSIKQMTLNDPTSNSRGLRFGNFVQVRDIINEELELVWAGEKSADTALDDAVARGNDLLRRFERQNK